MDKRPTDSNNENWIDKKFSSLQDAEVRPHARNWDAIQAQLHPQTAAQAGLRWSRARSFQALAVFSVGILIASLFVSRTWDEPGDGIYAESWENRIADLGSDATVVESSQIAQNTESANLESDLATSSQASELQSPETVDLSDGGLDYPIQQAGISPIASTTPIESNNLQATASSDITDNHQVTQALDRPSLQAINSVEPNWIAEFKLPALGLSIPAANLEEQHQAEDIALIDQLGTSDLQSPIDQDPMLDETVSENPENSERSFENSVVLQDASKVGSDPASDLLQRPELSAEQNALTQQQPNRSAKNFFAYGGLNSSAHLTALLATNSEDNLEQMSRFGMAYGAHLGVALSPNLDIEAGVILDSRQGSAYQSQFELRGELVEVTRSVQLHYTQIPITFRWNLSSSALTASSNGRSSNWRAVGGLQYGLLRTSTLLFEDKLVSPQRDFNRHDFSLIAGIDYDWSLSEQLFISMGLRGGIGLNSTGVNDLEGINLDRRNTVLGMRFALNYGSMIGG